MSRVGQYDFPNVHEYNSLAQKLEQMKQRQREIASDEMQAILEQRDLALAKVSNIYIWKIKKKKKKKTQIYQTFKISVKKIAYI